MAKSPEELAREISNFVNGAGEGAVKELAKEICGDHRTLQQVVMGVFMECVANWAEAHENGMYDARNEATVKVAAKIKEIFNVENSDRFGNDIFPVFVRGKPHFPYV